MQISGRLTIPSEHYLHDLIRAQWAACHTFCLARELWRRCQGTSERLPGYPTSLPPILGSHLDEQKDQGNPEKGVEAMEGVVGSLLVLPVKSRELPRKDHVPELFTSDRVLLFFFLWRF